MQDECENKLPKWAQDYINSLRERMNLQCEPYVQEILRLKPEVKLLQKKYGAIFELLNCAAAGEHLAATEIINILDKYDLVLSRKLNN